MTTKLSDAWGMIRAIIPGALTFTQIKNLVGAAGLPVHKLAHLQQRPGGASKGQLMDGIDELFGKLDDEARDRFVTACVESLIAFDETLQDVLNTELNRVGWGVTSNGVYPLRLQIELETAPLDDRMREGISKTVRRYRDGDFDGAITAICGMVDSLTERVYTTKSLGNHHSDKYQERISKVFRSLEGEFRAPLEDIEPDEIDRIWNNHRGAVSQAAYVLGAFRREYSDTHGVQRAAPELVQRTIDCAVFIVRSIGGLL